MNCRPARPADYQFVRNELCRPLTFDIFAARIARVHIQQKEVPSLHDIVQFRKAMAFIENPYPFSPAFGPARTRKECIKSAHRVYKRLLRYTPGETVLHFDVIGTLAYDETGEFNETLAMSLLGVFLPDKDDLLPQIEFLQSIDS